jgi:ATP-dependent helicase/nuclease subunit A
LSGARFVPVDDAARRAARDEHGTSLVLEAGAGTGKTTLVVDRIEALVRRGSARLDEIAAVTFTENAATTLKLRLRERLEAARLDAATPADERARAEAALEVLERAQVSTIHALCASLLSERPLEFGVVPGFRTADEAETDLLFAESWDEWLGERLVHGDVTLLEAMEQGIPLEGFTAWGEKTSLRGLARTLLEQRDLQPLTAAAAATPDGWRDELLRKAARAGELAASAQAGDQLKLKLELLVAFAERSRFLRGRDLVSHLFRLETIPRNFGHKPRWPSADALDEARAIAAWTGQARDAWSAARGAALHGRLVESLLGVVAIYGRKKIERGVLDFLDLLQKAHEGLRDRASLRRYFQDRFQVVIVDEFQDTDPLQVKIVELLAGGRPGALVVVGDAKQSIYRFRRAEVAFFRRLSEAARAEPGKAVLQLTQNFRSRPAILRFVNHVFADVIQPSVEAGQPAYEAIAPPPGLSDEPSVVALRFSAASFADGAELLRAEAGALAAWITAAAAGRYPVRDPVTGEARKSRAGDVMVLARRLTQMRHLEDALEAASLRFTVEGGKSFFDRQEVHEVLAALRAIEDPTDKVALVAALRSSFFGASDRDIVSYALAGGTLALGSVLPDLPGAAAIGPALVLLERLHKERLRLSVPALLERLYDETRVLAAYTGTRRGEAQVANLQKVTALARQATDLGVLTLRGFAALLRERTEAAGEEPDLPTTRPGDPDTVRVLSIHKAKGLEAPIVVLYDTADNYYPGTDTIPIWDEGRIAIGFRRGCQPAGWDALVKKEEAKAWAEARRLLYVACTRARDYLVVPQPPADSRAGDFWREIVTRLPPQSNEDVLVVDAEALPEPPVAARAQLHAVAAAEGGDAVAARWDAARKAAIEAAAERPFVPTPATRVAARTAPPFVTTPGRGVGRDFGRLVHRVLEWAPLGPEGPDAAAAAALALAPAFGLDRPAAERAAAAVRRVLELPLLARARAASRIWRELPLVFPDGDALVEGVVDLLFEEDGGLVVVDYKTDEVTDEQAIDQAAHHAPQLQLYGRGLAQATGRAVKERLVVFTALGRAVAV